MKTLGSFSGVVVVLACLSWVAVGAESSFGTSDLASGQQRHTSSLLDDPCRFTQNANPDKLEAGAGTACQGGGSTTDNQFLRVFDLDGDHGFGGQVCAESLDYGVEQSLGNVDVTFNVYCALPGIADDWIIERDVLDPGLVFSITISQPDAAMEFFNQPLGGCCDADTHDMVIEIATEDCLENGTCQAYYPGGNYDYLDAPYYIGAPDCGIDDPINADLITGLGAPPLVMTVHASCEVDEIPTTSGIGNVLLLLVLAALGSHVLRRRLTSGS